MVEYTAWLAWLGIPLRYPEALVGLGGTASAIAWIGNGLSVAVTGEAHQSTAGLHQISAHH